MRLHGPSPPQGKSRRSILQSLLPPRIQYTPPQGLGGGVPPPEEFTFYEAQFPPQLDLDYNFYKFYQINPDQVPVDETAYPLTIRGTFGPGVFEN